MSKGLLESIIRAHGFSWAASDEGQYSWNRIHAVSLADRSKPRASETTLPRPESGRSPAATAPRRGLTLPAEMESTAEERLMFRRELCDSTPARPFRRRPGEFAPRL